MTTSVSIIVATYNSSPFIIETLESVYNQTWKPLELIIADDKSTDDTVQICKSWVNCHKERFLMTKIIESEINSGVPVNLNRGVNSTKSQWLSLLAGDDTLKPDCIEKNILYVTAHSEVRVLLSKVDVYKDLFLKENYIKTIPGNPFHPDGIMAPGRTAQSQYRMLLLSDRIHYTPSLFLNKEALLAVGGFDERFKLVEDYPLWLNLTKYGYRLHFMDCVTVNYRKHNKAINNTNNKYLINPHYFRLEECRRIYTYPFLPLDIRLNQRYKWFIYSICKSESRNKDILINRLIVSILATYLNPFKYIILIRKIILRNLKYNDFYK